MKLKWNIGKFGQFICRVHGAGIASPIRVYLYLFSVLRIQLCLTFEKLEFSFMQITINPVMSNIFKVFFVQGKVMDPFHFLLPSRI